MRCVLLRMKPVQSLRSQVLSTLELQISHNFQNRQQEEAKQVGLEVGRKPMKVAQQASEMIDNSVVAFLHSFEF